MCNFLMTHFQFNCAFIPLAVDSISSPNLKLIRAILYIAQSNAARNFVGYSRDLIGLVSKTFLSANHCVRHYQYDSRAC